MKNLQYPIGRFERPEHHSMDDVQGWIKDIQSLPADFEPFARSLNAAELESTYRPGGWTARQVIHHISDSHLQAYVRFKWVLTEDSPTIKAYHEDRWAALADSKFGDIDAPLRLLSAIHVRWYQLLKVMEPNDFLKCYHHPETHKDFPLGTVCKLYAWHGRHHLAHLQLIKQQ